MTVNRQEQRSLATRRKLVRAARTLFARRGYAAVGTEEIARRAGVTRGALYHQFPAKEDLFLAVYEQVEEELTAGVAATLGAIESPFEELREGIGAFLEACRAPAVQRIVLLDGPAVLGWQRWREVAERYGLGLIRLALSAAVEAGEIDALPVDALAHALMGALDEAALFLVREPASHDEVVAMLQRLLDGLRTRGPVGPAQPAAGRRRSSAAVSPS
jgi:AcrR family transcriptional regulator